MDKFSHLDSDGNAVMVDVSGKLSSFRVAVAEGFVSMSAVTCGKIRDALIGKGDVLSIAQLAGIMGAKRTSDLIPLCHPLSLEKVRLDLALRDESQGESCGVLITAEVSLTGKTGVEMEALTAVSIAALTVYDMCKSIDKGMSICGIRLLRKSGGRSGEYRLHAE